MSRTAIGVSVSALLGLLVLGAAVIRYQGSQQDPPPRQVQTSTTAPSKPKTTPEGGSANLQVPQSSAQVSSPKLSPQEKSTLAERARLALKSGSKQEITTLVRELWEQRVRNSELTPLLAEIAKNRDYFVIQRDVMRLIGLQADQAAKDFFSQRVKDELAELEGIANPFTVDSLTILAENGGIRAGEPLGDQLLAVIKNPKIMLVDSVATVIVKSNDNNLIREIESYFATPARDDDGADFIKKNGLGAALITEDPTFLARYAQQFAGLQQDAQVAILSALWRASGPIASKLEQTLRTNTTAASSLLGIAMRSTSGAVRSEACKAIEKNPFLCEGDVRNELSRLSISDPDQAVRKRALKALGN